LANVDLLTVLGPLKRWGVGAGRKSLRGALNDGVWPTEGRLMALKPPP
jgi:hypothetical protein